MPQLDPSHFPSQILWLVIAFSLLYLYLRYGALPRLEDVLSTRATKIEGDKEIASSLHERILILKQRCAEEMQLTKNEVVNIHSKILHDFNHEKSQRLLIISENFAKDYANLAEKITKEKAAAMEKIPEAASDLAILILKKATGITLKPRGMNA
jgi:F-type H+-transporting ATPase subunit b